MKYMFISVSLSNEHFMVLVKTDGYYTLYWVIVVKLDTPKLDRWKPCRFDLDLADTLSGRYL
jgi:hypothetical protein